MTHFFETEADPDYCPECGYVGECPHPDNCPRQQRRDSDPRSGIPGAESADDFGYSNGKTGAFGTSAAAAFDPWEPYIVPDFPLHVLPTPIRKYVIAQSEIIGCDHGSLAMAALTAISGALDHRFAVKMMRTGNWWEHPRLWTLLVGDPSRKKTPIINDVAHPLERHQNHLRTSYEATLRDYEAQKKNGKDVEKPPLPARYVVWDSTTEKLGEILSRSAHGLLVKRDEFAGWIGSMERYASGSRGANADRGFWLQAFDGGPHAVDRVGRGETYINNLSVSLLGGIQPARLAQINGLTSDGLLQRFIPVMMGPSRLAQDRASDDDTEDFQRLVYKLIAAKHERLFLSDDALRTMTGIRSRLHEIEQASGGLAEGFQAFVGKLSGIAGRLTVILHMADNPERSDKQIDFPTVVDVDTLISDFILPHALEFYRSVEGLQTNSDRLRIIASFILTCDQTTVTARDLARNVHPLRGMTTFELNKAVSPLVAGGWLEPQDREPTNRVWTIQPTVAAQFAERRRVEDDRKAFVAKLMGSPRK